MSDNKTSTAEKQPTVKVKFIADHRHQDQQYVAGDQAELPERAAKFAIACKSAEKA